MPKRKKFRLLFVFANKMMENLIPVNLSILSAVLKEKGIQVKMFDTTYYRTEDTSTDQARIETLQVRSFDLSKYGVRLNDSDMYEDFRALVKEYNPHLIGLCIVEDTYKIGIALLDSVKDMRIPTIAGGVHAILVPDEVISESCVDMVCTGEGENALAELCEKMRRGEDYSGVPGIWVKQKGRIIKNPMAKLADLDKLPFLDFSIYEAPRFYRPMQGKVYKMLPVETGRGCPFGCTYCAAPALRDIYKAGGKYFRKKSIERAIDEIRFYKKEYGMNYVYFTAETFLSMSGEDFTKFVSFYADIKLPFWFQTRPETIRADRIGMLQDVGCDRISVGVESGNERVRRKVLNRQISNEVIVKAFDILAKFSIPVSVNNIIGLPDETREEVFDTIYLNRAIKADTMSAFIFTPYRGTELRRYCIEKGYLSSDAYSAADMCKKSILNMPTMTDEEIRGLARAFPLYVKFPEKDFRYIKKSEKFDEEGNRVFKQFSERYKKEFWK